jgi:hypothetical protein
VDRIRRHWLDRLLSVFMPLRRYRCQSMACHWEGTLRDRRRSVPPNGGAKY